MELKEIPIKDIRESKTNPRKTFDFKKLQELADSIKEKGLIQAVILRPQNGHYELVCGQRRLKAHKIAGLDKIKAEIKEYTDEQVLEIQVIENCNREDVSPLEEAEGFESLIKNGHYDVQMISDKIGKSKDYIYKRLQLLNLIPEWRAYLTNGSLTASHALILSTVSAEEQLDMLEDVNLYDSIDKKGNHFCALNTFKNEIMRMKYKRLSNAGWKSDDADLYPEAGSCKMCPKRTGFNKDLFGEITTDDMCTDGKCYEKKEQLFLNKNLDKLNLSGDKFVKILGGGEYNAKVPDGTLRSWEYEKVKKNTPGAQKAIITSGQKTGNVVYVKVNKDTEKKLTPEEIKIREDEKLKISEFKKKLPLINKQRKAVLERVVHAIDGERMGADDLRNIIDLILDEMYNVELEDIIKYSSYKPEDVINLKKKNIEVFLKSCGELELWKMLRRFAILGKIDYLITDVVEIQYNYHKSSRDELYKLANRFKFDVKTIEKSVEEDFNKNIKPESGKKKVKGNKK